MLQLLISCFAVLTDVSLVCCNTAAHSQTFIDDLRQVSVRAPLLVHLQRLQRTRSRRKLIANATLSDPIRQRIVFVDKAKYANERLVFFEGSQLISLIR